MLRNNKSVNKSKDDGDTLSSQMAMCLTRLPKNAILVPLRPLS